MYKETTGTVISVAKQWWLKINTKAVRTHAMDGAIFPYVIKVTYTVDGVAYVKRKWINAGYSVPSVGAELPVRYCSDNPKKAQIQYTPTRLLMR
jgi:hypothetical protein